MMPTLHPAFRSVPLAHRGLHDLAAGRPENTVAAGSAAVSAGYGVEIDVQPSRDGQAMVFHDETLDRLTDRRGPIARCTAAELSELAVLGSDQTIPTLPTVLAAVGGRVPVLIEIKDQSALADARPDLLETAVAEAVTGYDGPVAVMSFNPAMVTRMAELAPGIARGLTTGSFAGRGWRKVPPGARADLQGIVDYDRVGACFISHEAADLPRPRVADLRDGGATVLCWTIRSARAEKAARRIAHNITFEGYLPTKPPA